MSLLWLRIAGVLYGLGAVYAIAALALRREKLFRSVLPAVTLGLVLHFVSLFEAAAVSGHLTPETWHQSESLLAFLLMAFFLGAYLFYKTTSPGIFVLPLVFLLTLFAAIGQEPPRFSSPLMRNGWIFLHIALIFSGYAALFFSFAASMLYLVHEKRLKKKSPSAMLANLPPLETIDELGYRSLLLGFPFMTLGLIAGSVVAGESFGPKFFSDPKIVLSLLMWLVYLVLLFTRWNSGWRGRRAAFLSATAFAVALSAWAANYLSSVHRFVGSR